MHLRSTELTHTMTLTTQTSRQRYIRGFALYVGLTEDKILGSTRVSELIAELKTVIEQAAPEAQTHATVALAPLNEHSKDLDLVRRALGDPSAKPREVVQDPVLDRSELVTIDITRKQVLLDGYPAELTYREFELLQFFVLREGLTVTREQVVEGLWADAPEEEQPSPRTIDVHVRRLRVKLGKYQNIIRTVRGAGYRFDRHADVRIVQIGTPSPDSF